MATSLNTNAIAFIGLCSEFCSAVETTTETEREFFIGNMLKLLPRIYISATDLTTDFADGIDGYIESALSEEHYDIARSNIEALMGEEDVFLEVFEEDMKYSETPVAASVSESLADIFQVLYNFLSAIRDTTDETAQEMLATVREDFHSYWSAPLCNVLRALNRIKMNE
ncbi:MAG: DUF5063 domain-containing protein [Bacteroidales bacterium]|nr:DUF5063 domain-containing protein [Bacteroidales bacterium]